ncbi:MAG: amidohydrolase family protein, partial [Gemmatimonadales bacterium]|nr:amidohydrolase family protein [Gemmatimonadales bacterium]
MPLRLVRAPLQLAALAGVFACRAAPADSSAPVDLVVYGRVWTGDSARPWAQAVAVAGDAIRAVGDSAEIARLAGPSTRVLSNGTAMVVPGFMDAHTHFLSGGFQLASVELRDATSPEEFVSRLKAYAKELRPGEWITGGNWDHERWPGAPLPQRGWIDSVTPNNPVFVSRLDGHMGLANSAALKLARV